MNIPPLDDSASKKIANIAPSKIVSNKNVKQPILKQPIKPNTKKQKTTNGYQNFINNLFEKDTFNRFEEIITDKTKFDSSCLKNFKKELKGLK